MDVRTLLASLALAATALGPTAALAQSTDGYHAIQVFPVVVDTASFAQRFHFRAAFPWEGFQLQLRYYPAQGTTQATPLDCPAIDLPTLGEVSVPSLRALCPGLPPGSAFGTLVVRAEYATVFAGYSRVSNAQGAGFSVEAFPANTFTSATAAVTGLRRRAASGGAPAYQTNCFVGNLAQAAPVGAPVATDVEVALSSKLGAELGTTTVSVQPGQLVRLLDVFAAVGAAAGDHDDSVATFTVQGAETPGVLSFCTVQDNTSFGADFRIGKQELAWGTLTAAQDETALRIMLVDEETPINEEVAGAPLAIPAGATRNVHLLYLRHPDLVTCGLMYPGEYGNFLTSAYGLEIRLRVQDDDGTWRTVAGGNNVAHFESVYLGDKPRQGAGANTRYQLEVESNGLNEGLNRAYVLACLSGSGSTRGELLRKGLPTTF
jgi:hypothetical protein